VTNLENRGLDFADLDIEFFAASIVLPAKAGRLKAIWRIWRDHSRRDLQAAWFPSNLGDLDASCQPKGKVRV